MLTTTAFFNCNAQSHSPCSDTDHACDITATTHVSKEVEALVGKVAAMDGVIMRLRDERMLWSRELAAQGASLACDRGQLEARTQVIMCCLCGCVVDVRFTLVCIFLTKQIRISRKTG